VAQFGKFDLLVPHWARYNIDAFVMQAYRVNPLVRECIEYRCRSLTAATMYAMREVEDGKEKLTKGHWMQKLLRRPSNLYPDQTSWMQQIERQLQITGECFVFLARSGSRARGRVGETQILPGNCIQVAPGKTGVRHYEYRPNGQLEPIIIKPQEMIFFRYDDPHDPLRGVSPLAAAWREIQADNSMTDYRKAFFDHAAVPSLILTTDIPANAEQLRQWSENFTDMYGGPPEAGKVATLGGGLSADRIGATPAEIDFGNVGAIPETRICMAFGVHPVLIAAKIGLDRATYSNIHEAKFIFWEDTVVPEMERLSDRITVALTQVDDDHFMEFDISQVAGLQGYREKETAIAKERLINGFAMVNEARMQVGLERVEDGNVYYRPGSLTPVPEGKLDEEPPDPMEVMEKQNEFAIAQQDNQGKIQKDLNKDLNAKNGRPANQQKDKKKAPTQNSARSLPEQHPDAYLLQTLSKLHSEQRALEEGPAWDRALYVARVQGAVRRHLRRIVEQNYPDIEKDAVHDWLDWHTIELGNDAADCARELQVEGKISEDMIILADQYTQRAIQAFREEGDEEPIELSDSEWAELHLEAAAIATEVMEQGESAYQFKGEWVEAQASVATADRKKGGKHGPSIKCPDIYEALRREGRSKKQAAKISNDCNRDPNCNCH
jgi:HK97 family phage portal protein